MQPRITRFILALVAASFCAVAFSYNLPDAGQDLFYPTGNPSWHEDVGGKVSLAQERLLLASESSNRQETQETEDLVRVCRVKTTKKGRIQYKLLKFSKEVAEKKAAKRPDKYFIVEIGCDEVAGPT